VCLCGYNACLDARTVFLKELAFTSCTCQVVSHDREIDETVVLVQHPCRHKGQHQGRRLGFVGCTERVPGAGAMACAVAPAMFARRLPGGPMGVRRGKRADGAGAGQGGTAEGGKERIGVV
jgi:hypothetical protein